MAELVLTTYDWVPELPRGYVRDLRIRWALEEAGLAYRVESTPFHVRGEDHYKHQPFGQVPWLTDGDMTVFESGAILLHLGERSEALMPADPCGRTETIEWLIAGLNSVEMASVPWSIFKFADDTEDTPGRQALDAFLASRLQRLEKTLSGRDWLAGGRFTLADIVMADALRLVDRFGELAGHTASRAYIERATARPAFIKAHADQMDYFAKAD
ncbi:MAG: glutathione S-transferase family protein [Pseudomonadota bacterium]|nr:glutathione S-transferase family protein [Pseudomonadota bacterium]